MACCSHWCFWRAAGGPAGCRPGSAAAAGVVFSAAPQDLLLPGLLLLLGAPLTPASPEADRGTRSELESELAGYSTRPSRPTLKRCSTATQTASRTRYVTSSLGKPWPPVASRFRGLDLLDLSPPVRAYAHESPALGVAQPRHANRSHPH